MPQTKVKRASRRGSADSETGRLLIDVTERLMLREGYAVVTSRRVALEAGVTGPLVHYYFPTLDDLFRAVLRRRAEEQLVRQRRLLAAKGPLRGIWAFNIDRSSVRFISEFTALAVHRKKIQSEIAEYAERFRAQELSALVEAVERGEVNLGGISPAAMLVLLSTTARGLVNEEFVGTRSGHGEFRELMEALLAGAEQGSNCNPFSTETKGRPCQTTPSYC